MISTRTRRYDVVVLDEVHERHVSTDLLLGMMKHSVLPRAPNMRCGVRCVLSGGRFD